MVLRIHLRVADGGGARAERVVFRVYMATVAASVLPGDQSCDHILNGDHSVLTRQFSWPYAIFLAFFLILDVGL